MVFRISGVAPLPWVEANIRYFIEAAASEHEDGPAKIMMGLNFYGYDRTGGGSEAILGKKYVMFPSVLANSQSHTIEFS